MIRQKSAADWRAWVESQGSLEEQLEFIAVVRAYRDDWAVRKQALTAQYKDNLQDPAYLAAKAVLQTEAETQLLAYGFYEEVTEDALSTEFVEQILEAVVERPLLILRVVTRITNYYRAQREKPALTEAQVRARLLA
ncbi:MAG: hypothetical protein QM438_02170 [Euryarchaeota archaeon]|nr:hypothetical protein [Euryarchaeota archaeon]